MSRFYRVAGSIWEGLKISTKALGTNKTRSILTATCIVIGIVSVTTMSTTIDGIDRSFEKSMSMLGQNVIYVEKWPWGLGSGEYRWWEYRNRPDMKISYVEQLEERSRFAEAVSASANRSATVRYGDKYTEGITLQGATQSITRTGTMDIEEGRFFTAEEERTGANVVVMGQNVSDALFEFEYPPGKEVQIAGRRFLVIGLLERQGSFLGLEDIDNQVIIPMTALQELYGTRTDVRLTVKFPDEAAQAEGEYEVEGLMRQIRQLDPLEENDFAINRPQAFRQQYESMTFAIYGIGIFLTSLSLFIGGIGVMNIMFVSVRERTQEIGIRKAVGAKAWEILTQFLIEATIICIIGGIIGVLLSIATTQVINQFLWPI
ncbi:MAG: ABC transporter permease [Balneolaceae bacterium]|nr:ABC transporter permease [Balneolaceae bacterium]